MVSAATRLSSGACVYVLQVRAYVVARARLVDLAPGSHPEINSIIRHIFQSNDKNGDRKLSRTEWLPPDTFAGGKPTMTPELFKKQLEQRKREEAERLRTKQNQHRLKQQQHPVEAQDETFSDTITEIVELDEEIDTIAFQERDEL